MSRHFPATILFLFLSGAIIQLSSQDFKQINIEIAQDSIDELESHPYTNEDVHGSFTVDGIRTDTVELHYRGAYYLWQLIRWNSVRNWKVKFQSHQKFENRREWNFNYEDYLRQNLAYHLFRLAGVPCVSTENVILSVNGVRQGLYLKYEDPDNKDWLADTFGDEEGDLYKAAFDMPGQEKYFADLTYLGDLDEDYYLHYRKQTNNNGANAYDYRSIREFTSFINHTSEEEFLLGIADRFAVDEFIKYLVISNFIANWDGYPFRPKNYFLYNNPQDQKWYFIPWDLDGTFQEVGTGRNPIGTTGSVFHYFDGPDPYDHTPNEPLERPLVWRLMAIKKYRDQYIREYKEAMEGVLSQASINVVIDSITSSVQANISGGEWDDYLEDVNNTRGFIGTRIPVVSGELDEFEVDQPEVIHVSALEIPDDSISILEGELAVLTSIVSPQNADDRRVQWASGDTSIVAVSAQGIVRGMSAGSVFVSASSVDGGFSDSCRVTVDQEVIIGIEDTDPLEIKVFPNPAGDVLHIRIPYISESTLEVHLINMMGQTVYSHVLSTMPGYESGFPLNLQNIPAGQYILRVQSGLVVKMTRISVLK